jgi:hypothetical protein
VEAESAYIDILFDGRPLVVLGLDRGILQEGETVRGVGIVDADDSVVSHPLDDVTPLNVNI